MSNERLPIKFFAKREVDNQRTEAGGSENLPKWILDEEKLAIRSQGFVSTLEGFRREVLKREQSKSLIPLVVKARIIDDATAKTHRREVRNLFRTGASNNVLGLAESDEIIVKIENSRETDTIIERLKNTEKFMYAISCIDSIEGFNPVVVQSDEGTVDYKVKLIDYQNYEQNNSIRKYFENSITKMGLQVKKTNYTADYIVYNVKSVNADTLNSIKKDDAFNAVFSIEPMPMYSVSLDFVSDDTGVRVMVPEEGKRYVTVGILDSGVADIPHLKPWLRDDVRWTAYPEEYIDRSHGSFVTGVVLYGDQLEDHEWIGVKGVRILDACVFPNTKKEEISEDELIRNIQEAVKRHYSDVKIWNLSISINRPVDEFSFSDFAIALDSLQDEYNVLICKSAGNCKNFLTGHPKGKIHEGADSVRSIVVGSIAHKQSSFDLAEIDNPSPFTRIGRGPSFVIKPEVVHYGGNAGLNKKGELVTTGVKSFGTDGSMCKAVGTSFSTPRITALAAGLYQEMDEEFDPLLIKSLIVHSASYSEFLKIPYAERVNQVGFGRPQNIKNILYNSPNEVTLILRDEMAKGEYFDIMDFPMPECLVESDYYNAQIIVTLVYNPILEPSQRGEYCQSNIDIKLGTFNTKKDRDTTRRNILNPVGRDGAQNLLLESCYSKRKMKDSTDDFALKERLLIQYGDKYYPVKKYAVNLAEISDSNKLKYLTKDKKWYLLMKGLFREHIETKAQLESSNLSQEFCLVVTIRDPSGTKPVYDQVTQKLDEYNFWHNNIKLQSEIELHI